MKTRVKTAVGICMAICTVLLFSGFAWFLDTVIACLCLQSIFELYRATGAKDNRILYGISFLAAAVVSYIRIPHYEIVTAILFILAAALFLYLMFL